MSFKNTLSGDTYDFHGIDEFGENDYMTNSDIPAVFINYHSSRFTPHPHLDEDMKAIDTSTFNNLPKYMSIEVIDSLAYNLGIKDNDLILAYGPEYVVRSTVPWEKAFSGWIVAETTMADKEKDITIYRIDSVSPEKSTLRTIRLPKGRIKDLGFDAHLTFKTRKQENRIRRTADDSDLFTTKANSDSVVPVLTMRYKSAKLANNDSIDIERRESGHGILIKADFSKIPGWTWAIGNNKETLDSMLTFAIKLNQSYHNADINCRYTVFDGQHLLQFTDSLKNLDEMIITYIGGLRPLQLSQIAQLDELIPAMKAEMLPEEIKVNCAYYLWDFFPKSAVGIYESYKGELPKEALDQLINYYSTDCKDKKKVKLYKKQSKTAQSFFEGINIINLEDYY